MRKYTKEEDKTIKLYILNNPGNISKACRELGEKLDRTPGAIAQRWYYKLSKDRSKFFMLYGRRNHTKNRKNVNKAESHKISMWEKFMLLFN